MDQRLSPDLDAFYDELIKLGQDPAAAEAAQGAAHSQRRDKRLRAAKMGLLGAGALAGGYGALRFAPHVASGALGGLRTAGKSLSQPGGVSKTMKEGWRHLGKPTKSMSQAYSGGGAKGVVKELGERGWVGKSGPAKYLPVGGKSLMMGLPAAFLPMEAKRGDPEFTGQGRAERIGRLGGETAGWIAGAPIGAAGGAALGAKMSPSVAKALGWGAKSWGARGAAGLGGALALGALGGAAGRLAGRPIDMLTGERQQAQSKKGLKTYLEHRQKQALRAQRAQSAQGAAY